MRTIGFSGRIVRAPAQVAMEKCGGCERAWFDPWFDRAVKYHALVEVRSSVGRGDGASSRHHRRASARASGLANDAEASSMMGPTRGRGALYNQGPRRRMEAFPPAEGSNTMN